MAKKIYIGFGLNAVDANSYAGWDGRLKAAEFDIEDLSSMATNMGFEVRPFFGKDATIENLRAAFAKARMDFGTEGGLLWFNFSGHGGQNLDRETVCLFNGQMLDTSLRSELQSFPKSVKAVALFDCCHAGGLDRGLGLQMFDNQEFTVKAMHPDTAIFAANNLEKKAVNVPKGASVVKYICACQKEESAYDGRQNGLFTAAFKSVMQADSRITYKKLIAQTAQLVASMQHPRLATVPNVARFSDNLIVFEK